MAPAASLFVLVLLASTAAAALGNLQVGYYRGRCGEHDVEGIIHSLVKARFFADRTITAALIRMQYHDCFVKGCDASLLLDGNSTEKTAFPNQTLRDLDFIDEVKEALERLCPGVVSCADIIIVAARDAVAMAGGLFYEVQTGRRDCTVSRVSDVDLPTPFVSADVAIAAFEGKGLSATDMVVLLGGHSVGVAHCFFFSDRLYDFQGSGKPDPSLDPALLAELRTTCRPQNSTANNTVFLDQNPRSAYVMDSSYYRQLTLMRGVLQIDEEIWLDPKTRSTVAGLADSRAFPSMFARAMVKLGSLGVLTGEEGVIRRNCRVVNRAIANVNNQTAGADGV